MMSAPFVQFLRTLGPLRQALITLVIVDMILRPIPGEKLILEGWLIAGNLIAPVLAPILFMLLLLDSLMSMVYRSDKGERERRVYLVIALFDFALAIAFILYWLPFFRALNV